LTKDIKGNVTAIRPPPSWPGVRKLWRNGEPITGTP
jgi:hypothetical protein